MASLGSAELDVVGKVGRVTGLVAPDLAGEVTLNLDGSAAAFDAFPADGEEVLVPGTRIVVLDYAAPRTVTVARIAY
jgi:hypothetical protein